MPFSERGVPPRMKLSEEDVQPQLTRRRPGQSALTTPRDEKDRVVIQVYTLSLFLSLFLSLSLSFSLSFSLSLSLSLSLL